MNKSLPRWFAALMVIVLLTAAATVVTQLFHQASLTAAIDEAAYDLTVLQKRLEKQQAEYDQILADLPVVLAEAEAIAPDAQAAYDQEQALRQQRKELRAENAALAEELAALQTLAEQSGSDSADDLAALEHLYNALEELRKLYQPAQ